MSEVFCFVQYFLDVYDGREVIIIMKGYTLYYDVHCTMLRVKYRKKKMKNIEIKNRKIRKMKIECCGIKGKDYG